MSFPGIQEFKEKLLDGGARASMFRMNITWPPAVALGNVLGSPLVPWQCRLSEIPASTVGSFSLKYAGREVKFAGQRTYSNLNLTIINDGGFRVRRALEAWHDAINTRETNIATLTSPTGNPGSGYAGTGTVDQYDQQGNIIRSYVFIDLWPVNVGAIPLDWSQDSAIEDYPVEFAYQYWVPGDEYTGSSVRQALTR